jgi:hypothetical protein
MPEAPGTPRGIFVRGALLSRSGRGGGRCAESSPAAAGREGNPRSGATLWIPFPSAALRPGMTLSLSYSPPSWPDLSRPSRSCKALCLSDRDHRPQAGDDAVSLGTMFSFCSWHCVAPELYHCPSPPAEGRAREASQEVGRRAGLPAGPAAGRAGGPWQPCAGPSPPKNPACEAPSGSPPSPETSSRLPLAPPSITHRLAAQAAGPKALAL